MQDEQNISLVDLLDNLFYFRWHFIATFVFITTLVLSYAILATPVYVADALIQVEEKKGSSLGALSQVANALGAQQSPVLGEIEILRSRSVIGRAVDDLHANIEVEVDNRIPLLGGLLARVLPKDADGLVKPLWQGERFAWGGERISIDELVVPPSLFGKKLVVSVEMENRWKLLGPEGQILASGLADGKMVAGDDGRIRVDITKIRARPGTRIRVVVFSIQSRINQILRDLVVSESKRQSSILKLTYESPSPAFASAMLNAISDIYVRQNIDRRSEEAELSLKFLNEELPKLRIRLDASEKALNDFRSKSKTVDITSEIKELLARATSVEKSQLELDLKRREYAERYDSSHPFMKALASQLIGIKSEQDALTRQIGQLPGVEQDYIRLARDVQVNNQLYVSLLNNAQQLQIAKAGTIGNVAIVDRAVVPEIASRPRKVLLVSIGGLMGLFLGFVVCQILGMISQVVRDPKKLEYATGLPTLAILPFDADQSGDLDYNRLKPFLLAKEMPGSSTVEALRSLRTAALFKLSEKARSKVVLITSAVPAQGKSFIAVNLGYLFSATGKKVILVEADIRMASSKRYIEYDEKHLGLSTVLKENVSVDQAIIKDIYPNFDFIPAGPTVKNPGDLLATERMASFIDSLADNYDFVIIDSPPLLPVHDARSLGRSADLVLFVARQDDVSLAEVHDAIDVFSKSGNSFDGLVFNGFVPSRIRYGYGYGYGYRKSYRGYRSGHRYGKRYGSYGSYGGYGGDVKPDK